MNDVVESFDGDHGVIISLTVPSVLVLTERPPIKGAFKFAAYLPFMSPSDLRLLMPMGRLLCIWLL